MGSTLVGDLISNVEDFSCNMKCGFFATFYEELNKAWCNDLLAGFLDIAVSLVLLGLFNIPVCICAAVLVNRFRGRWRCGVGSLIFAGADESGRSMGEGKLRPGDEGYEEEQAKLHAEGEGRGDDAGGDGDVELTAKDPAGEEVAQA